MPSSLRTIPSTPILRLRSDQTALESRVCKLLLFAQGSGKNKLQLKWNKHFFVMDK